MEDSLLDCFMYYTHGVPPNFLLPLRLQAKRFADVKLGSYISVTTHQAGAISTLSECRLSTVTTP